MAKGKFQAINNMKKQERQRDDIWAEAPSFGFLPDLDYIPRPGSYGIAFKGDCLAVIKTKKGYYLPGGGADPGESEVQALHREFSEELGQEIVVGQIIGRAIDYVVVPNEGNFAKLGSFYYVKIVESISMDCRESEGELLWLHKEEASALLKFPSQKWAVNQIKSNYL